MQSISNYFTILINKFKISFYEYLKGKYKKYNCNTSTKRQVYLKIVVYTFNKKNNIY